MLHIPDINQRNPKAWEQLFADFYAPLCVYIENKISNHEEAEDIVQETLMKIWQADTQFQSKEQMTFYLYRAVHNRAISFLRKQKTHLNIATQQIPDTFDDEAYEQALREELYRQLYVAINQLPTQQRRITELSIKGKTGKEIADILGISINTVKAHKQKAIDTLRKSTKSSYTIFLLFLLTH